jgi:hypothetical protein
LELLDSELGDTEQELDRLRPKEAVSAKKITPEQERYFALRGLVDAISEELDRLFELYSPDRIARLQSRQPETIGRKSRYRRVKANRMRVSWAIAGRSDKTPNPDALSAASMEESLNELSESAETEEGDADILDLEQQLALLRLMANAEVDDRPTYLWIRGNPTGPPCKSAEWLAAMYQKGWRDGLHVEVELIREPVGLLASDRLLLIKGVHARPLAETESGTHLFCPTHGNMVPVRVETLDAWPSADAEPFAFGPILRSYLAGGDTIDHRTGLVVPTSQVADSLRTITLATLQAVGG